MQYLYRAGSNLIGPCQHISINSVELIIDGGRWWVSSETAILCLHRTKYLDGNFQRISTFPNVHQKLPGGRVWVYGWSVGNVPGRTTFGKVLTLRRMEFRRICRWVNVSNV